MTARAPLVHVTTCPRDMKPGQVKRCMLRGPLVGYYLACPKCGFRATYLHDDCQFVEERAVDGHDFPRRLIGIAAPPACYRCALRISVVDGFLEAA
jgi:hypothetical protein